MGTIPRVHPPTQPFNPSFILVTRIIHVHSTICPFPLTIALFSTRWLCVVVKKWKESWTDGCAPNNKPQSCISHPPHQTVIIVVTKKRTSIPSWDRVGYSILFFPCSNINISLLPPTITHCHCYLDIPSQSRTNTVWIIWMQFSSRMHVLSGVHIK